MERFFRSRFAVVSFDTEPAGWGSPSRATSPSASAQAELRVRQEMLDLAQTAARAVAFDWYIGARERKPLVARAQGMWPGAGHWIEHVRRLEEARPSLTIGQKLAKRAHESGDVEASTGSFTRTAPSTGCGRKVACSSTRRPTKRMVGFMSILRIGGTPRRSCAPGALPHLRRPRDGRLLASSWSTNSSAVAPPTKTDRDAPPIRGWTNRPSATQRADGEISPSRRAIGANRHRVPRRVPRHLQRDELFHLASRATSRSASRPRTALAAIVESSDDAIISKDLNGIITTWNTGAERILVSRRESWPGRSRFSCRRSRVDEVRGILERMRSARVDHFETIRRRGRPLLDISLSVSRSSMEQHVVVHQGGARHQRAQACRGELARKGRCAGDGPDGASSRVAADDARRADHLDCPRGRPALGRDDRQRGRLRALARRRAARPRGSARGARQHRRRRQARARGHRANSRAHEAPVPRKEMLDVNHEVLEVLALTEQELRSHDIVLRTQLDRTLPRVAGDRVQLQQVLINLIMNAIEAMSGVRDRPRELTIVSGQDGPNAVMVEVRDSGTGLDPRRCRAGVRGVYTTKAEGIGIGLSISRSIVEAHGGRLWASANEPHGAVFRFSLPVTEEALMSEDRPAVFVIDDDPSMRRSLDTLLRSVALDVHLFSSTQEFMHAKRPEAPGCLVLDVQLPGMSGLTFQQELAKAGVALPIIFISGHGDVPMTVRAMKAGAAEFLTKPFEDQVLLDAIHAAIERDRARRRDAASLADLKARYRALTSGSAKSCSWSSRGGRTSRSRRN